MARYIYETITIDELKLALSESANPVLSQPAHRPAPSPSGLLFLRSNSLEVTAGA